MEGVRLVVGLGCVLFWNAPARAVTEWADFHGAASTAGSTPSGVRANQTTTLTPPLYLEWSYFFPATGSPGVQDSTPSVADGLVFVGSTGGKLYAWNLATGSLAWTYATSFSIRSSPAVASGAIYMGTGGGAATLHAVNETDGTLLWSASAPGMLALNSSATVDGGLVLIGAQGSGAAGALAAFNTSTRSLQWTASIAAQAFSVPAVDGGNVLVGATDAKMYAFSTSGTFLWSYATGASTLLSSPVASGGVVYFGASNGVFYALNETGPTLQFSYQVPNATIYGSPALWGSNVYCAASLAPAATPTAGVVYGWNTSSGAVVSGFPVSVAAGNATPADNAADSSVAAANNVVYVRGANNLVQAFDASNGALLWSDLAGTPAFVPLNLDLCSVSVGEDRVALSSPRSNGIFVYGPYESPTATFTPGASPTSTASGTLSGTFTATVTTTPTGTMTGTFTASASTTGTATLTATTTRSATSSASPSASGTSTNSPSMTVSATQSGTPSVTATPTASGSPTVTASQSTTPSPSGSVTSTSTVSATATFSGSPTESATSSPSGSPTVTPTVSGTATPSGSSTPTATVTLSATASPSGSSTNTPTTSGTSTATASATESRTSTPSDTVTPTFTVSGTATPSGSPTFTATITATGTVTETSVSTSTATPVGGAVGFPDPFDPTRGELLIRFPPMEDVSVSVFNVAAEWVVDVPKDRIDAGAGEARWNGNDATGRPASSGVYYLVVRGSKGRFVTHVVLLR